MLSCGCQGSNDRGDDGGKGDGSTAPHSSPHPPTLGGASLLGRLLLASQDKASCGYVCILPGPSTKDGTCKLSVRRPLLTEHLLCARHWCRHFTAVISLNPPPARSMRPKKTAQGQAARFQAWVHSQPSETAVRFHSGSACLHLQSEGRSPSSPEPLCPQGDRCPPLRELCSDQRLFGTQHN